MNKKTLISMVLLLLFAVNVMISADATSDSVKTEEGTKKEKKIKLTELDIYRIAYWSTYGATGLTSFINTFAQFGYAYSIAQRMSTLAADLEKNDKNPGMLTSLSTYYPYIVFGSHFMVGGLAGIPMVGGITYGTALFIVGIAFSVNSVITPAPFDVYIKNDSEFSSQYEDLLQIYNDVFNPVPYYAVGAVSILFGIGEIITTLFYLKEKDKKKYPYMQKVFTFNPGPTSFYVTIKLSI